MSLNTFLAPANLSSPQSMKFGEHRWTRRPYEVVNVVICRGARSEVKLWSEHFGKRRPKGGVVVLGIFDLEGEVSWGSCNSGGGEGGGVEDSVVGDVDNEAKMYEEVSPDERDGDVCNDELPLEGAATEGELKRLVSVGDDVIAVGHYQIRVGAQATTTVNHGLREEGSAGTCVDEEADTCEGIKHKENISGDRGHR